MNANQVINTREVDDGRLLRALAEQLKTPILQIARQAELTKIDASATENVSVYARMALDLLDGYILGTKNIFSADKMQLEPIAISSLLYDIAHNLSGIAGEYNCQIELHLSGKYQPVMVHKESLKKAISALSYSFLEAQPSDELSDKSVITLAAHKTRHGIIAGVYGEQEGLSSKMYRRAKLLHGKARQTLPISPNSSAGIFLADYLLGTMSSKLHVSRHNKLNGLAATLLPSHQLNLV